MLNLASRHEEPPPSLYIQSEEVYRKGQAHNGGSNMCTLGKWLRTRTHVLVNHKRARHFYYYYLIESTNSPI